MGPRTEQHRPVMSCNTASRVVQAEKSGGGWALDTCMLLFQTAQLVVSRPAALWPHLTAPEKTHAMNLPLQCNDKQVFLVFNFKRVYKG